MNVIFFSVMFSAGTSSSCCVQVMVLKCSGVNKTAGFDSHSCTKSWVAEVIMYVKHQMLFGGPTVLNFYKRLLS